MATWTQPTANALSASTYIKDTDDKLQSTMDDLEDFVNSAGSYVGAGLTDDFVDRTNAQTVGGIKTFTALPAFNGGTTGSSAPFTVDSTFLVTNLNSQYLNGIESTQFIRSDTADTIEGVLTYEAIPAFNGGTTGASAPFTVDSTFVVTNLNADLLDGQQGSYYAPIDSPTFTGTVELPANTVIDLVSDTTPQLGGDLDFNGKTMNESAVRGIADATPLTGTTHTFDYSAGDMQQVTCPASGTLTLAFSNFPSGDVSAFICDIVNGGNCTITHPTGMLFQDGVSPSYTTAGTDRVLVTSDKDAVLTLTVIAFDIKV